MLILPNCILLLFLTKTEPNEPVEVDEPLTLANLLGTDESPDKKTT